MPKAIYLTLACGQYDINQGLITGEVVPQGIELSVITAPSPEGHWRMVRDAEFEVCEFSIGTYLMVHERDRSAVVAIPAFPHRRFQHGYIFVATASGIRRTETARGAPHRHPDLADLGLAVGVRLPARRLRRRSPVEHMDRPGRGGHPASGQPRLPDRTRPRWTPHHGHAGRRRHRCPNLSRRARLGPAWRTARRAPVSRSAQRRSSTTAPGRASS